MKDTLPIYVICEPGREWLLCGFAYLFNRHWEKAQCVSVVSQYGQNIGALRLPDNFAGYQVRKSTLYSDTLISLLKSSEEQSLIILTESHWLRQRIQARQVESLYAWAEINARKLLRIDLTNDRQRSAESKDWAGAAPDGIRLVYSPPGADGVVRFTPSIWNRESLLQILIPGENRVQIEMSGGVAARSLPGAVFGACVLDVMEVYQNTVAERVNMTAFDPNTIDYMRHRGWLRRPARC